jgi:hypothetical protein
LQEAIDKLLDTQGTIDNGKDIHMWSSVLDL